MYEKNYKTNFKPSYQEIQKNKLKSVKFIIFVMMFIFSLGVLVVLILLNNHQLINESLSEVFKTLIIGLFGLASIVVGGKVYQNVQLGSYKKED